MSLRFLPSVLTSMLVAASAFTFAQAADKPVRVILVGDSTMASNSGYGDALCARFVAEVACHNLARGGRSSSSFRAEKRWDEVQGLLKDGSAYSATYVLVQFGHNDQPGKAPRSTDLVTQFPANMARYAVEVKELGGVPVLVTPLTRRIFKGPYVRDDLGPWAGATRRVAQENGVALLDLNALSRDAVQQMGSDEANTLAQEPPPPKPVAATNDVNKVNNASTEVQGAPKSKFDYTHLGDKGAKLFSGMVATELTRLFPSIKPWMKRS